MNFIDHCNETTAKLGNSYPHVHRWMDEFYSTLSVWHRKKRHHLEGIEMCGKIFGSGAKNAAMMHVVSDLREDGNWKDGDRIPGNEEDYVNMGLF